MEETEIKSEEIIKETPRTGVEPAPQAQIPAKPWSKIALFSILGLFLVGSLVFVAYRFGQKQTTQNPPTPTLQLSPTPVLDETATWQTYTNQNLNFSFKYPDNFMILSDKIKANSDLADFFNGLTLIKSINKDSGQPPTITLFIYDTTKTVQEFVQGDFNRQLADWETEKQRLGSNLAKPVMSPLADVQGSAVGAKKVEGTLIDTAPNSKYVWYLFKKNNLLFRFSVNYGTYNPDTKEDGTDEKAKLDQILSTFKFLDQEQNEEVGMWKKYTNQKYQYSLSYPSNWILDNNYKDLEYNDVLIIIKNQEVTTASTLIFSVHGERFSDKVTLDELKQEYSKILDTIESRSQFNQIDFKGKTAIQYKERSLDEVNLNEKPYDRISIASDNNLISIVIKNYGGDKENQKTLDQILSTFKFL